MLTIHHCRGRSALPAWKISEASAHANLCRLIEKELHDTYPKLARQALCSPSSILAQSGLVIVTRVYSGASASWRAQVARTGVGRHYSSVSHSINLTGLVVSWPILLLTVV